MFKLGLLFISVTSIELILLLRVGSIVGLLPTMGLIVFTGFLGAHLTRLQGLQTLRDIQGSMSRGVMPTSEILDGLCILIAGAFLLTPGILTDMSGFLLLTPAFRQILKRYLTKRVGNWISKHSQMMIINSDEDIIER